MAHTLAPITINTTHIGGITQQGIRSGTEVIKDGSSGCVDTEMIAISSEKPGVTWTTRDIAAMMAISGTAGAPVAGAGVMAYAQKYKAGGSIDPASVHRKFTFAAGLVVPVSLQCQHQQDAALDCECHATYDGVNDPLALADSQAPPPTASNVARFSLGPVTIESVLLSSKLSLNIAFGLGVVTDGSDSEIWPTIAYINERRALVTLRGVDPEWLAAAAIPIGGKSATHINTKLYLRKRAAGGTYVANNVAEHIKLTAAGFAYCSSPFGSGHGERGECEITIPCLFDGTNAPLTVATASAIT